MSAPDFSSAIKGPAHVSAQKEGLRGGVSEIGQQAQPTLVELAERVKNNRAVANKVDLLLQRQEKFSRDLATAGSEPTAQPVTSVRPVVNGYGARAVIAPPTPNS
jgi:hypothetical protein